MTLLLSLLLALQPAPAPTEPRTFGDWIVGCDNGRRCTAIGLHPEAADYQRDRPANLIIEREAGPDGAVLLAMEGFEGTAPERLQLDGAAVDATIGSGEADSVIVPRNGAAFLEALRNGQRLDGFAADGTLVASFSLRGLSAAMLVMDEAQRRIGTTTALVRRGSRPASAVPAAPALPVVRLAPRTTEAPIAIPQARLRQLMREAQCDEADLERSEDRTSPLGGGATLLLLPCGSGAYNFSSVPFVVRRQGSRLAIAPAQFDTALNQLEQEEGHRLLVNAGYDRANRMLEEFTKGRGLGDCGTRATYGWDGQRFRLLNRQEMPECRGSINYVTTWRAQAR